MPFLKKMRKNNFIMLVNKTKAAKKFKLVLYSHHFPFQIEFLVLSTCVCHYIFVIHNIKLFGYDVDKLKRKLPLHCM